MWTGTVSIFCHRMNVGRQRSASDSGGRARWNLSRLMGMGAVGVLVLGMIVAAGYRNATASPVVRHLRIALSDYPRDTPPLRLVLFADLHIHGPDMPPSRVAQLVREINGLHPDLIVAAGDFVGNNWIGAHYSTSEAIAPLRRLRAKFGVYAVLGNNDYEAGAGDVLGALRDAGIHVLANQASKAGPLALGGLDGRLFTRRASLLAARNGTYQALEYTPGIKILVAHRPDEFVSAPRFINLVVAGHTHCGQIVLPLIGPLLTGSDYGRKYACGIYRDRSKVLVVTAGLGTSHVPLRIGAPPDIWVILITGRGVDGT